MFWDVCRPGPGSREEGKVDVPGRNDRMVGRVSPSLPPPSRLLAIVFFFSSLSEFRFPPTASSLLTGTGAQRGGVEGNECSSDGRIATNEGLRSMT